MPTLKDLLAAKQTLSSRLLRLHISALSAPRRRALGVAAAVASAGRNVHAVGIGRKIVDGKPSSEECVRLYVVQKLAPSLLSPRDVLPEEIDGIPTDVIESTPPRIFAARRPRAARTVHAAATPPCSSNRRERQRPVVGGISAAHRDVTAGTIACFCRSTRHGDDPNQVFVLSNNHVFAEVNAANVGDDLYQPGPADGGAAADHFADLHRFVTIQLGGTLPNKVDAAIGKLRPDVPHLAEICSIGAVTGTRAAEEDMLVRKHGRTSGYTEGRIDDIAYDGIVGMDHSDDSVVALFQDQIRIVATPPHAAIGLGGDSGSLIVHRTTGHAVGLYFAGPPAGDYGLANHIGSVLTELEIAIP